MRKQHRALKRLALLLIMASSAVARIPYLPAAYIFLALLNCWRSTRGLSTPNVRTHFFFLRVISPFFVPDPTFLSLDERF